MTLRFAVGPAVTCMLLTTGCVIPLFPSPLASPGYGRTYRIVDSDDQPVANGVIYIKSGFPLGRVARVGCYPFENGVARVPRRVVLDWYFGPVSMGLPVVWMIGASNATESVVYVIGAGCEAASFETDGVSATPRVIRLDRMPRTCEVARLNGLADGLGGKVHWDNAKDGAAKRTLRAYVQMRLEALGADDGTGQPNVWTSWRFVPPPSTGLEFEFSHSLHDGKWLYLKHGESWIVDLDEYSAVKLWREGERIRVERSATEGALDAFLSNLDRGETVRAWTSELGFRGIPRIDEEP